MQKIVLYARCSTPEQNIHQQIFHLQEYCKKRNWENITTITDEGYSGTTNKRPGLEKLLSMVRRYDVNVVCIQRLDRLCRSLKNFFDLLALLNSYNCHLVSLTENIDLTSPMGKFQAQILASVSELEANLIRERVVLGLAAAKAKGKVLGRPPRKINEKILRLRAHGHSYRQIQKLLNCSPGNITRALSNVNAPKTIEEFDEIKARFDL